VTFRSAEDAGSVGEFGLIRRIRDALPPGGDALVLGPGDDAAILSPPSGEHLVFTVDTLTEDVHFRIAWTSARQLGARLLVQGLSDVAAMGARPLGAVVALSLPAGKDTDFVDGFLRGLLDAGRTYRCPLAGGNLSRSATGVSATAALTGSVSPGRALRRERARAGQSVWVTGTPGAAAAGLAALEKGSDAGWTGPLVKRFLEPRPRLDEAAFLRDAAGVEAAIDLSDGVRRCASLLGEESRCALALEAAALPSTPELEKAAGEFGRPVSSYALDGGEDFELLFTAEAGAVERVKERFEMKFGLPLTRVGTVEKGEGLTVHDDPGRDEFQHFG
jgi:thiamine-monophosphate kinase